MQAAARTTQRTLRASIVLSRPFSSCSPSCKPVAAASSSASSSSSENSQSRPQPPKFRPRTRDYDSLSKRESPNARYYDLRDSPSTRFTIRTPSSPAPVTLPPSSSPSTSRSSQSATVSESASPVEPVEEEYELPPQLHKDTPNYSKLTPEQVEELQQLRTSDPSHWTRSKLAAKYNVSPFYVGIVGFGGKNPENLRIGKRVKEMHDQAQIDQKEKWGFKKRVDREVRRRRKEFW